MSRSSPIIRNHAEKMRSESADLTAAQREMILFGYLPGSFRLFPARAAGSYQSGPLRPRKSPRHAVEKESAVKPGSVLDSHSSGMRVAAQL